MSTAVVIGFAGIAVASNAVMLHRRRLLGFAGMRADTEQLHGNNGRREQDCESGTR